MDLLNEQEDAVGGYFELEITDRGSLFHDNAIALNTGRNAIKLVAQLKGCKKVHVPCYSCPVIGEALRDIGVSISYYRLRENFIPVDLDVRLGDAVLLLNYFGVLDDLVVYGLNQGYEAIVDNAQAFFSEAREGVDTIYSPRKFFGVADGAFLYTDAKLRDKLEIDESSHRVNHLIHRVDYGAEAGFSLFQENEAGLRDIPILRMSRITRKILRGIDYISAKKARESNFMFLHRLLKDDNELSALIEGSVPCGPMVYPFLRSGNHELRQKLISHRVYVARYWPGCIDESHCSGGYERYLYDNLISLPIDQRYNEEHMNYIASLILN